MSQTLQNQLLIAKSMNGIITLTDGAGSTITNGTITTGNISGSSITGTSITGTSFSTVGKSQLETVITLSTGGANTPYTWAYNSAQIVVFTGTATQVFNLPVVSTANLGTNIVIYRTGGGTFTINAATGYNLYDFNNAVLSTRPLNSNDRWISLIAVSTGTTQWQMTSQFPNSLITATLSLGQTFSGLKTFNAGANFTTVLPTTALAPVSGNDLVNKTYADSIGTTLLSSNNVWTGTNAFNTSLPTSTQTPTTSTQLVTKVYADALPATLLGLNNVWTGTNAFDTSLPTSTQTPTTNTQLITKVYADALPATLLSSNNAWTGTNSFNTSLPTSTQTPSSNTQLITKVYADGIPATIRSSNNAWTGTNSFNTSLPTSTQTPSSNTQLITKVYADGIPATIRSSNNTWSGTNLFNNNVTMGTGYFLPYFPLTNTSMRIGLNTLQNSLATSTNNVVWGNGAMQGTTNPAYTNLHTNTVVIGNGALSATTYGTTTTSNNDNVIIGHDSCKNICFSSNDNVVIGSQTVKGAVGQLLNSVVIGSKINVNSGFPTYSVIIGSLNLPNTAANFATILGSGNLKFSTLTYFNGGVIIGYNSMIYAVDFNRVICIGDNSLSQINNNISTICIGMESLNDLTTGTFVCCFGSFVTTNSNLTNCTILGTYTNTAATNYANNSVYIGGNDNLGNYQDIVLAKKNRLYSTQTVVSGTSILLEFETPENVVIDNVAIVGITLPAILAAYNIGTKYSISRSNTGISGITIDAGAGFFIQSKSGLNQSIYWSEYSTSITLVCVSTTKWNVVFDDFVSNILTTTSASNASMYVSFFPQNINGGYQNPITSSSLTYNPSNGLLSAITVQASTALKQTGLNGFGGFYPTAAGTLNLAFGDPEIVVFENTPAVTAVQLPSVNSSNIGAKYTFVQRDINRNYNLLTSGTDLIYDFKRQYSTSTFACNGMGSITICAAITGGGTNAWVVLNRSDGLASAAVSVITANFSLATASNLPIRDSYSVANGATAITITLPQITLNNLGLAILFRRVATATATVSFIGNGTQFVYGPFLSGGAGAQALMNSTTYTVRFTALAVNATPTYAWFQT